MAVVDQPESPKKVVVLDDQLQPNSLLRRVAVVAVAVAGVVCCPSVACVISPRVATSLADSKTTPELVNEKTDEDTGQSLGYRFRLISVFRMGHKAGFTRDIFQTECTRRK